MTRTIGNPLSWTARHLSATGGHVAASTQRLGGDARIAVPEIRTLTIDDLRAALRAGLADFQDSRADAVFAALIYPIAGLALVGFGLQMNLLPLLFPLAAGFALLGPLAATGLYEISRRREAGEEVNWLHAFRVVGSPSFAAIMVLGLNLGAVFLTWMMAANAIYVDTLGPGAPVSITAFLRDVFTTPAGWTMIVVGLVVGFVFALVTLAMSVVSFPLLVDRNVGVPVAIVTSIRVTRQNPRVVLTWGAIVAVSLLAGAIPLLLGLTIVMPILGHATWHLYRRAVV